MLEAAYAMMEPLPNYGLTQPTALHTPAWLLETKQKKNE